jgi:hypothetical protein
MNQVNNHHEIEERTYLEVPYHEKDIAKNLGCRWDSKFKKWYSTTDNPDYQQCKRWISFD